MEGKANKRTDLKMKQVLEHYYQREEKLRLAWFRKNENRLMEIATKENAKGVSDNLKEQLTTHLKDRFQNAEKFVVPPYEEDKPISYDTALAAKNIMRPVDPEVTQLLYKGTQKEGRVNYLKERYKVIPEQRYYFTECSSFEYGWKMSECAKEPRDSRFGRQQVIKNSFYRRRGVQRDPDWYCEPAKLSPTTCGLF